MPSLRIGVERGVMKRVPNPKPKRSTGPPGEQAPPKGHRPLQRGNPEGAVARRDTEGGETRQVRCWEAAIVQKSSRLHACSVEVLASSPLGVENLGRRFCPKTCPKVFPPNLGGKILSQSWQRRFCPKTCRRFCPKTCPKVFPKFRRFSSKT